LTPGDNAVAWSTNATVAAFRATVAAFERDVPPINALNVFPVPDGDTGTNMFLTLKAICDEVDSRAGDLPKRVDDLFKIISRGALMGARGNSGVILYQIIAGLGAGTEGAERLDGSTLARGFDFASDMAYLAVNNPVEGTMLSVIRASAGACHRFIDQEAPIVDVLETARQAAEEALEKTPDQLPILKQAGVVDAGGQGLVSLISGLERFARGELEESGDLSGVHRIGTSATEMHFLDQADVVHGLDEFGYCINFSVTGDNLLERGLRDVINAIGTSTVIVGDSTMMKIHTHSEHPGTVLETALSFGDLHDIRIDNMKSQTQRLLAERHAHSRDDGRDAYFDPDPFVPDIPTEIVTEIAVVAVGTGDGIIAALKGMGAQAVVSGGTSMNPSTSEIRKVIESLDEDRVILLPNNSNIVAAARHAANLVEKSVEVVPTTSIQQGIAALAAFNFAATLEENAATMTEAIDHVRSLAVARASRDVQIDDLEFRAGEFMGMLDGKPRITGPDVCRLTLDLLETADAGAYELATVFVGRDADKDLIERLEDAIAGKFPDLELEITSGGQPHYDLLISLE
jgi:uncharacterized protein